MPIYLRNRAEFCLILRQRVCKQSCQNEAIFGKIKSFLNQHMDNKSVFLS